MEKMIHYFIDQATNLLQMCGPVMGIFLVFLESIIPILPLGVFVTLNMHAFGYAFGFVASWLATCFGCYISYLIFSSFLSKYFYRFLSHKNVKTIKKSIQKFQKIPLGNLTVIIALPFTPAFLVNIVCGLANVKKRKFLCSILIGKLSIIYFWGFIGTSFLESMTDIKTIIIICLMLIFAYFLSKVVSKKMDIE